MPSAKDLESFGKVTALLYSPSGSGKTSTWAVMSKHPIFTPIYCFDFDLRIQSILRVTTPKDREGIKYDHYRDSRLPGDAYVRALAKVTSLSQEGPAMKFKTIVLDSLTFMVKSVMNQVLHLDGKPPTFNPQLQHYLTAINLIEPLVSQLAGMPCNFITTAHEDTTKDEVTQRVFKAIDVTGKQLTNRLPGYFNEFWHPEVVAQAGKEGEFRVRTQSDTIYPARTCFTSLLPVEKQSDIWGKISAELSKKGGGA